MKKTNGIKIVKRGTLAGNSADNKKTETAVCARRIEMQIARRISGWVSERRERRQSEDLKNLHRLFGETAVLSGTV